MRGWALLMGLAVGCRGAESPGWAVLHGDIRETDTGVSGNLVWELFEPRWGRKQGAAQHMCARVLVVEGEIDGGPDGCNACTTWAVRTDELDTDCVAPWDTGAALAGPTHIGLGPLPEGYDRIGAHGAEADGWYLSWDGERLEPHGVAHDQALDLSAADAATRSETTWVLTPAAAYQLGQ